MKDVPLLLLSLFAVSFTWSCSEAQFASGEARGKSGANQDSPAAPVNPGTPSACTEKAKVTGAHLLFLLDNSGSMEETDCPGGRATCMGETDREKSSPDFFRRFESHPGHIS